MSNPREIPQEVVAALMRGDKIGAIKLIREATGGDLKGAMAMIQTYAQQMGDAEKQRQRIRTDDGHGDVSSKRGAELSDHLSKGLSDGRAERDALMNKTRPPTVMAGDSASSHWVWLLLGLLAIAAWIFFG
ncbi:MAG: hypothetical protein ABL934_16060 [Lysobacteraceae bacterium]